MEQHTVHRQIPSSLLCTACHPVAATNYYIVVGQQQAQHSTVLPTLDAPNLCHCTLPGFQSKGRDSRSLLRKPPLVPVPVHRRCFIFFSFLSRWQVVTKDTHTARYGRAAQVRCSVLSRFSVSSCPPSSPSTQPPTSRLIHMTRGEKWTPRWAIWATAAPPLPAAASLIYAVHDWPGLI